MPSRPHGPYVEGSHRATWPGAKRADTARWSQSQKACRSRDRCLQRHSMESEALVLAVHHAAVLTSPGHVHTAPHTAGVDWSRSA